MVLQSTSVVQCWLPPGTSAGSEEEAGTVSPGSWWDSKVAKGLGDSCPVHPLWQCLLPSASSLLPYGCHGWAVNRQDVNTEATCGGKAWSPAVNLGGGRAWEMWSPGEVDGSPGWSPQGDIQTLVLLFLVPSSRLPLLTPNPSQLRHPGPRPGSARAHPFWMQPQQRSPQRIS